MDLIATAKCGLLDRLFEGTFLVPLMPTVFAVTAFTVAHVLGRILAHLLGIRPLEVRAIWPAMRIGLAVSAVVLVVMMLIRGVAYPLFLLRMAKDAYYCSGFEAGRDLTVVHLAVFGVLFLAHGLCVAFYDHGRFRSLDSVLLKGVLVAIYVVFVTVGYLFATVLDATLVPLTILFVLPFAYCGVGMLARPR